MEYIPPKNSNGNIQERQAKRDIAACATNGPAINGAHLMNIGDTVSFNTTPTGCVWEKFTVGVGANDIVVTFNWTQPLEWIIGQIESVGSNNNVFVGFFDFTNTPYFEIPICFLTTGPSDTWWVIGTPLGATPVAGTINLAFLTPTATVALSAGGNPGLNVPTGFSFLYANFQIPSSANSVWIQPNFTAVPVNNNITIYADPFGPCAANFPIGISGSEISRLRTFTAAITNISFAFETDNDPRSAPTTFGLNLAVYPVTCQVPTGLSFCANIVNYPIADYANAAQFDQEAQVFWENGLAEGELSSTCQEVLKEFSCGIFLERCDANEYDRPPCSQDCSTLAAACPLFVGDVFYVDECTPPFPANSNCYVTTTIPPTSTTTHSAGTIMEISYVIGMLAIAFVFAL